jgi:glycosyltransferase involved in cell wall biosynthesis
LKVKVIISRFGETVIGGAERHCMDIIKILPSNWDVEVLTTTAKDYITWKNEFKTGTEKYENYRITRYPVEKKRNLKSFNQFTDVLRDSFPNQTEEMENNWLLQQGPYSPKLIDAIKNTDSKTDLFLFFSYLYYPTVKGIPATNQKSIIVPMFHDELPIYFSIYKKVFTPDKFYAFNSPEELELFERIFGYTPKNKMVVGTYVDTDTSQNFKIEVPKQDYVLSVGRMDVGKGFRDLVEMYSEWYKNSEFKIPLKIIGKNPPSSIREFESKGIEFLGYVDDEKKSELMRNARFLINPSSMESFSIVLMESWSQGTPVLVNANSLVMKGHCQRSNGGLYYSDWESFTVCMDILLEESQFSKKMGHNGRLYVEANFSKDTIKSKLLGFIDTCYANS